MDINIYTNICIYTYLYIYIYVYIYIYIVANHIFNLPHALHLKNNQGKKENIVTWVLVGDSEIWWKAVGN